MVLNVVAGADGEFDLYEDAGDNADYATEFARTAFSQKYSKGKTTIILSPVRGTYAGMSPTRSYTLRVYNADAPSQVTVDGRAVTPFYDAAARCIIIEVPSAPRSRRQTVTIK